MSGIISSVSNYVACKVEPYAMPLVEKNVVPDALVRLGVRRQCAARLQEVSAGKSEEQLARKEALVEELKNQPIAIETDAANTQHYEVLPELYKLMLGPRLKYSSGYWPDKNTTFAESEVHMLELYCERAELEDGMHIVDLGCGWGSLSLFLAEKYPNSKITGLSNSANQKAHIDGLAAEKGWGHRVTIHTINITEGTLPEELWGTHDRVMSIEMFEHMKNYGQLMEKASTWLKPEGKLFVHIFSHKDFPYHFEIDDGFMGKYFFTGGTMPSDDLLLYFQDHFKIQRHWRVNGTHYSKTSEAWLKQMDDNKAEIMPILTKIYGEGEETKWFVYWRLFYIACAELFGFAGGEEWLVSHYLFQKAT